MNYNNQENIQTKPNNTMLYITIVLLLVSVGFTIYTYLSHDMVKKGDLNKQYVKVDDLGFELLPSYVKDNYIQKYTHTSQINNLKNQISQLQNQPKPECKPEIIEKIVEKIIKVPKIVERVVTVEKIVEVPKIIEKQVTVNKKLDKSKFDIYRCYDMADGGIYPAKECLSRLHTFLDKHKNAPLFEVIGIVNNTPFTVLKNIKKANIVNSYKLDKVSKLAQLGLSQQRVTEGTWSIKNYLGASTPVQVVDYTIKASNATEKGFIVRAYK